MEGACDGVGKTTQFELLEKYLSHKEEVVTHHFPSYGVYQGMFAEYYLQGKFGNVENLSPYFVNSLYAVDRATTFESGLRKAYDEGKTILLDRYTTSSIIYQSAMFDKEEEKDAFIRFVLDYEYEKLCLPKPDKVILLTADFDVIDVMRKTREKSLKQSDIHERNVPYLRKVYENALFLSKKLGLEVVDCMKEGKMRSKEEIHEEIVKMIER